MLDDLTDHRETKAYRAIVVENELLRTIAMYREGKYGPGARQEMEPFGPGC